MWVKKGAIGAIGSVAHNMYVAIVAGGGFDDLRFLIALQQPSEGFVFCCVVSERESAAQFMRAQFFGERSGFWMVPSVPRFFQSATRGHILDWQLVGRGTIIPGLLRRIPSELRS